MFAFALFLLLLIPRAAAAEPLWPLAPTPHPAAAAIPAEAETDIPAVARYLASHETDPFLRVKLIHDYAIRRLRYDTEALAAGQFPPQDAAHVFASGRALCGGYAQLVAALGRAMGLAVTVIPGEVRTLAGDISAHSWNAVRIQDRWYLLDATWDGGVREDGRSLRRYGTDYLLTPPEIFALEHFPSDPAWLLGVRLDRDTFRARPLLTPQFVTEGFLLESSQRLGDTFVVALAVPKERFVLAQIRSSTGEVSTCAIEGELQVQVRCLLKSSGHSEVRLFASATRSGSYPWIGSLPVR